MGRIVDVLGHKGRDVHTIGAKETVFAAIDRMVALNVGSLVVLDDGDAVCGLITERDYLGKIALRGRSSRETPVADIMTSPVRSIPPDVSVADAMALMTELRHRHFPVVENGRLIGLVSMGDLVKHLVRDQEVHIQLLTDYIGAKYPG